MLMVIFGAGASYDSFPSQPPDKPQTARVSDNRPPLADQLFDNRGYFVSVMSEFPKCKPIIPDLQQRPKETSVEQVLQRLQTQAEKDPIRHQQLAAIRYYLHVMMCQCENRWHDVTKGFTNHITLIDKIRHWRKTQERICLVTFNYDKMLESVLPEVGITIRNISDYIASDDYKLVKLHGSINWAREVDTPIPNIADRTVEDVASELINRAADLSISQRYRIHDGYPIAKSDQLALFPALAIPIETKSDYECPREHLETLRSFIPEVTKLLVIGWRATEYNFLQLLVENHRPPLRVMVVSGRSKQAQEVIDRLQRARIKGDFIAAKGGFTNFILSGEADEFLQR